MKALQKFSAEYLEHCRLMSAAEIVQFLENFRLLHGTVSNSSNLKSSHVKSRLISIKIPEDLLGAFRVKAGLNGVAYQTQIKRLMMEWVGRGD